MIATKICQRMEPYAFFNTKVHPFYAKKKVFFWKLSLETFCFSGDELLPPGVQIKSSNTSTGTAEKFFVNVSIGYT